MTMLTFKEMCAKFDVTPRTLRYYEYIELLSPVREGRSRLFGPREVARMTLILRGKRFGFSLEEMRQLLDLYDREGTQLTQLSRTRDVAAKRLDDLERRRMELEEAIAELKEEIAWADDVLAGGRRDLTAAQ